MSPDDIGRLGAWLAATDIGLLELRGPTTCLTLRQEGAGLAISDLEVAADTPDGCIDVVAASVGVFLHRHPLRTDDLAPPGSAVAPGQPLGLLQVGPLLLPVPAPAAARVQAWLVPHGTTVGYGTPLVALLPDTTE